MEKGVYGLAQFLQQSDNNEPASNESETTGETEEIVESQEAEIESEEYEEEIEASEETEEVEEGEAEQEPDWHTVKVDGEELQVTLEEALAGYQRDSDYRKKTMSLAEERKLVSAEKERINQLVGQVDTFIKGEVESIDWETLKTEDPAAYINKQEELKKAEQLKQQLVEEQQSYMDELINTETKALIDVMGGEDVWGGEQRNVDMKLAAEYLKSKGFSEADMNGIVNHRIWTVIFDAAKAEKFKATEARIKEQVRTAPKSVKPGQKIPPGQRKVKAAKKRIANARNSQEGVSALADLLKL